MKRIEEKSYRFDIEKLLHLLRYSFVSIIETKENVFKDELNIEALVYFYCNIFNYIESNK